MMQINYLWPTLGAPPTANVALKVSTVSATLSPTNSGDNSQIITHAFNLSNAQITQGWPKVFFEPLDSLAQGSNWYVLSQNPNFTIVGRGATTASLEATANAGQVEIQIDRIWSGSK